MGGQDHINELDALSQKLSLVIGCGVKYPAYGKNIYECCCKKKVSIPMYMVKAERWEEIKELHESR
jgi:hypothetical protein